MCSGTNGSTVNWCIGSILPSAATVFARLYSVARSGSGFRNPHHVPDADAEAEEQHQQRQPGEGLLAEHGRQTVQTPSDDGTTNRSADQMPEELLPKAVA